jgi:serine/threonine protein kinase
MNEKRIVHRDIKLENVVLLNRLTVKSPSSEVDVKIIDFGTAYEMRK